MRERERERRSGTLRAGKVVRDFEKKINKNNTHTHTKITNPPPPLSTPDDSFFVYKSAGMLLLFFFWLAKRWCCCLVFCFLFFSVVVVHIGRFNPRRRLFLPSSSFVIYRSITLMSPPRFMIISIVRILLVVHSGNSLFGRSALLYEWVHDKMRSSSSILVQFWGDCNWIT